MSLANRLVAAIKEGSVDKVKSLLKCTDQINAEELQYSLREAAVIGNMELFDLIVKAGADVTALDKTHRSILMYAARGGSVAIVKSLLSGGADVNAVSSDSWKKTALLLAAEKGHAGVLDVLIAAGASVKVVDGDGWTALMYAAIGGSVAIVKSLLSGGANVNAVSSDGLNKTALLLAIEKGHVDVLDVLIGAGANVEYVTDASCLTALMYAAKEGSVAIVKSLLSGGANVSAVSLDGLKKTALLLAAEKGHVDVLEVLIAAGANVNDADGDGRTAVMYAAKEGSVAIVKSLLSGGAAVNAFSSNKQRKAALLLAAGNGHADVFEELIAGAGVNNADADGWTVLMCAAKGGSVAIVKSLLSVGADVNAVSSDGLNKTALLLAVENGHVNVLDVLIGAGANVEYVTDASCLTALMYAAKEGSVAIVKSLLSGGADVNSVSLNGLKKTALLLAAEKGHVDVLEVLIAAGANVKDVDGFGSTPLIAAIFGDRFDCLKCILEAGADPNIPSKSGLTPLMLAAKVTNVKNVSVELLAYGAKNVRTGWLNSPITYCNSEGKYALHRAIELRRPSRVILDLIAQYQRALFVPDKQGRTPIDIAASMDNLPVLWILMQYQRSVGSLARYSLLFAATRMSQRVIQSVHIHLLGHGFAGKTTCRKALNYSLQYLNPVRFSLSQLTKESPREVKVDRSNGSGKTEGMEMEEVESPNHKWLIRDYGGQEKFHVNHARFLSVPGSVYVIVVALWDAESEEQFMVDAVKRRYIYWLKFLNSVSDAPLSCITVINFAEKVGKQFTDDCVSVIEDCMSEWQQVPSSVKLCGKPIVLSLNVVAEVRQLNDLLLDAIRTSEEVNSFPILSYIKVVEESLAICVKEKHRKVISRLTFIENVCKPAICKLLSKGSIPANTLGVDFVCEKMIEYLISVGSIIVVPNSTSQDPFVVVGVNWLSCELLGCLINRMASSGNAEYVLTASQINDFTNNGGQYFVGKDGLGGEDRLLAFLESIGACIIVKDRDGVETKRWFPLCSQRFIVGKECIPMEKGTSVSFRKAVRLFTLSDASHQMFPPGYFLDLFLKILSLFSMENATTVKVFINAFEVEYMFSDARLQVLIILLDDDAGFTLEVSLKSNGNRGECWKRFKCICDAILNAGENAVTQDMLRVSPWFNNVQLTEMFVNPAERPEYGETSQVREPRSCKSIMDLKKLDESSQNLFIYGCDIEGMPVDEKDPPKHILEALFSKVNEMQQFLTERWNTVTVTVSSDMIEDAFKGMMKTLQGSVSEEIQTMMETTRQAVTADSLTVSDLNSALDKMKNEISVRSSNDREEVINELNLMQDFVTELTSEVKSIQQLNDKKLQESILRAMEECKTLHKLDKMMLTMLEGSYDIPTMAIVIPVGDPSMFNASNWTSNEYALFFLCAHTHQVVPCGPDGEGYKFRRAKDWFKKVAPVIKVCLIAAKIALTVTGIPIPMNGATKSLDEMSGDVSTSTQYLNTALNFMDTASDVADGLGIAVGSAGSGVNDSSVDSAEQYVKSLDGLLEQSDTVEAYKSLKALLVEKDPRMSHIGLEPRTSERGVHGWVKKGDQAVIDSFMRDEKWPMKIAELKKSYDAVASGGQSKLGGRSGLYLPKTLFGSK